MTEPAYALSTNKVFCNFCPSYCCYRLPGAYLFVVAHDINRLARYFDITDGEVRKKYLEGKNTFKVKGDSSCIFLSDGKLSKRCSVHTARPDQCRDFPYNDSCPYLESSNILEEIEPRIKESLTVHVGNKF